MTLKRCNELQTSKNASVTRGLGVIPKNYPLPYLKIVIDTLINKLVFTANPGTTNTPTIDFNGIM